MDNLTLIRGRNTLKVGADIRHFMGDATSTNAPFGALDFTRDIAGYAAAAFISGAGSLCRVPENSRSSWNRVERADRCLAHLGLAHAYRLQGLTAKARAAYQDFFTLWKDADPDIPVFKQAKAEYARLQEVHSRLE